MRIDAHQHFWKYSAGMNWITPEMSAIRRDFGPADLQPLLEEHAMDGCITVQVDQNNAETEMMLGLAAKHAFIKGVVGWIDLCAGDVEAQLISYSGQSKLKGFRHILQGEDPAFMLQPAFIRGLKALNKAGFAYDLLVYPHQLSAVLRLLEQCPQQRFVIDHLAKPLIKAGHMDEWGEHMKAIAAYDNVYCKVSGMVTEADWGKWQHEDFIPYLDTVSEAFGVSRLMFGSDWPVCLVAGSYSDVVRIVESYFSADEQAAVFGNNAVDFYQLT
jgi:L-fuconolactonase